MGEGSEYQKKIGITPYDIIGNLVPGGICVLSIYLFELWYRHNEFDIRAPGADNVIHTPLYSSLESVLGELLQNPSSWAIQLITMLCIAALLYTLGHVIASISAFFIDRVFIAKGHGYPYGALLSLERDHEDNSLTKPFYKGMYFWLNALGLAILVYTWTDYIGHYSRLYSITYMLIYGLPIWIAVTVIIKAIASSRYGSNSFCKKMDKFFKSKIGKVIFRAVVLYMTVFGAGQNLCSFLGSIWMHKNRNFDGQFIRRYKKRFKETFNLEFSQAKTNNFWMTYIYVRENSKDANELITNWLRLYAFSRNLGTAFFLSFVYCGGWFVLQYDKMLIKVTYDTIPLLIIPLALWMASQAMLIRYYFLYSDYFTKYIFRSFVYLCENVSNSDSDSKALTGGPPFESISFFLQTHLKKKTLDQGPGRAVGDE